MQQVQGESKGTKIFRIPPCKNNEHFWNDIIQSGHRKAGKYISLKEFHLTEWIPRSPGTYFLPESRKTIGRLKEKWREFYNSGCQECLPVGKGEMVLAGVGSLRVHSRPIDSRRYAFLGATSDGITHEGIPVAFQEDKHGEVIDKIMESFGLITNFL